MCRDRKAETEGRGRRRPARARRGVGFVVGFLGLATGASARERASARAAAYRRGGVPRGGALAGLTAPALESAAAIESARLLPLLLQSLIQGSTFFLGGDRGPVTRSSWTIDLWSSCEERKRNGPQPPRRSTSRHSLREDPISSSMRPSPVQAGFKSAGSAAAPSTSPWSWPPQSDVGVGGNLSRPDFTPSFLPLCMTALDDRSAAMSPALDVVSPPREPRPRKPSFPPIPSHHPSLMISFARVTHAFQHVSQVPGDDRGGIVSYRKDCNVFARFRGGNGTVIDRSCDVDRQNSRAPRRPRANHAHHHRPLRKDKNTTHAVRS